MNLFVQATLLVGAKDCYVITGEADEVIDQEPFPFFSHKILYRFKEFVARSDVSADAPDVRLDGTYGDLHLLPL